MILHLALPVAEYVEETKKEIKAMMSAIKQHAGSKTALQVKFVLFM